MEICEKHSMPGGSCTLRYDLTPRVAPRDFISPSAGRLGFAKQKAIVVTIYINSGEQGLMSAIFHAYSVVFHIDPSSKIRPKLPDREELINDAHLRAAAWKIVWAILNAYRDCFDIQAIEPTDLGGFSL